MISTYVCQIIPIGGWGKYDYESTKLPLPRPIIMHHKILLVS